jgi:hypothetical protein
MIATGVLLAALGIARVVPAGGPGFDPSDRRRPRT